METFVLIADNSQLVYLGLTGILNQVDARNTIRFISDVYKFKYSIQKCLPDLLIAGKTFLLKASPDTLKLLNQNRSKYQFILIDDSADLFNSFIPDQIILREDQEKAIYNKIEYCYQRLSRLKKTIKASQDISLREKEILKYVALGLTNKEIAEKLFISTHTVITHRKNITAKLGIKTIAGLTVFAVLNNLITPQEIK